MRAPDPVAADLAAIDAALAGRPHAGGDPALAELALLVRDVRPLPDPARASRMDSRVAAALRAPSSARRRGRWPAWLTPALAVGPLIALVAVVAIVGGAHDGAMNSSGGGAGSSASPAMLGSGRSSGSESSSAGSPSRAAGGSSAGGASVPPAAPGRAVERSASLRIATEPGRIDDVASGAARVATDLGGFVASSSVTSRQNANLDLRVPTARVDQAVERLSQLGRVRDLQRSTLDITDELTAARRRVQEARAERRSLLRQLAAAATPRQEERIRARLTTATRRLDRARADVARLRGRADNAAIAVTIVGERRHGGGAAPGGRWTPGDALHDAVRVLEVTAGVVLVALAVIVPIGVIGLAAWIASRRLVRRRREHALDFA